MNILLLSKEYPPHIYGGAGVHVDYLCREIVRLEGGRHRLQVLCFGEQDIQDANLKVKGIAHRADLPPGQPVHASLLDTLGRNLAMSALACEADIVHCHTWYTYLAGCLIKELLQIPLVITTHSLEPHRPWKREQLGTGYDVSSWLEETAVRAADGIIAVSNAMQVDATRLYAAPQEKVRVIHNGIDPDQYRPTMSADVLSRYGIQPARPYILFVGRITRQKGVVHLVRAIPQVEEGMQVVLCAGAPDTDAIAHEMKEAVARAGEQCTQPIVWIRKMIPREDLVVIYSHAELFVCPSVYEPFGIINLEAMACQTPVVASAVGGIPEVVVHGETGLLVPFDPVGEGNAEPLEPDRYARDLAGAINDLLRDPEKRRSMGLAARQRVEAHFSWNAIARKTVAYYQELCGRTAKPARHAP
jgi:alpha-maltose-1-phosphate synthase